MLRSSTKYQPFLGLKRPSNQFQFQRSLTGSNILPTNRVRRTFLSAAFSAVRDAPIKVLEKAANADPSNSMKQLQFLQALTDRYPAAAVRRFETPGYSYCENSFREYLRACDLTGSEVKNFKAPPAAMAAAAETTAANAIPHGQPPIPQMNAAPPPQYQQYASNSYMQNQMSAGSSNGTSSSRPLYVSMGENGGWKSQAWKTGRILAVTFIFVTAFGAMLDSQGLGSRLPGSKDSPIQQSTTSDKRFKDVVGVDEAKNELEEIVSYLREPEKFTKLGGKLPRGVLLTGPPGTGKTLLAKAIAGEAGVPFFYCSGSGFEEVYVGVGARRVRDLFEAAKKKSPCIIFIDEIDAIGGSRNLKDQSAMKMTLNEMLVQMDGFESNSGIIVIGATNFKQSLDAALTRPGRFDKIVNVPLPDVQGRKEILELYGKETKLDKKVDISVLARGTPGFSGAELYNLVNQAAVKASVEGLEAITHEVLEWAKDKILMGAERKSAVITAETAKCTAYHEAGHALCAILVEGADPVHKATIMPRGQALGLVAQLPEGDQTSRSWKQMIAMIDVAMGGRVAEELIFGAENITSGASSDLQQATRVARAMVTKYGFSREIGYVFHSGDNGEEQSSEATRIKIDEEVKRILDDSYARVTALLKDNAKQHKRLANALLEWETLTGDECRDIVNKNRKPNRKKENHRGGAKGDTSILGGLGEVGVATAARANVE